MSRIEKLRKIIYANSVAVIGASQKKGKVGNELILRLKEFGFKGKIYPINMNYAEVEGIPTYASVTDIKKPIDFALIATPKESILDIIEQCNTAGIKGLIIISSGFKELDDDGAKLELEIKKAIEKYDMTLIGPNCLGIINADPNIMLNACFAPLNPVVGKIGLATQSGALASGIINILPQIRIGLRQMISLGNQTDINVLDIIEFWEQDDSIEQILLYIESIPDSKRFKEICERVNKKKPIIVVKSGRSVIGTKATASHTGSLAGDDNLANALFESAGVIRELNLRDMFGTAQVFNNCNIPKNQKLAILTNAGGPGVLATDTASDYNIELAELSQETKEKLKKILPPQAGVNNPLDVIASATREQYTQSAEILFASKEVGVLLVIYLYITEQNDVGIIQDLEKLKLKYPDKQVIAVFMTTTDFSERLKKVVPNCTIPIFKYGIDAIHGLNRLLERRKLLQQKQPEKPIFKVDKTAVKSIIKEYQQKGMKQLSTFASLKVFDAYNIPLAPFGSAKTIEDAKKIAEKIGYPIVLKISDYKISHKSDVGGVVTNIKNKAELEIEWKALFDRIKSFDAKGNLECVIVMKQISGSQREFVAGIAKKQSSHIAMFGLGGVFVEIFKEIAFRACPLSVNDAMVLISSTKASKLLGEVRGNKAADIEELKNLLLKLSKLVEENNEIKEIDIN
ncbi:MAG: acetate--CoA ligase family protein, partial [Clostridia bacterium]|nr:acetate--CoA ligase family protein [Clostridia bacterium]